MSYESLPVRQQGQVQIGDGSAASQEPAREGSVEAPSVQVPKLFHVAPDIGTESKKATMIRLLDAAAKVCTDTMPLAVAVALTLWWLVFVGELVTIVKWLF